MKSRQNKKVQASQVAGEQRQAIRDRTLIWITGYRLDWLVRLSGVLAATIGGAGLLGWAMGIRWLTALWPQLQAMRPNAALAMFLSGLALLTATPSTPSAWRRWTGRTLALAVLLTAGTALFSIFTGVDIPANALLFHQDRFPVESVGPEQFPMRMGLPAAVGFFLAALALLLLDVKARGRRSLSQFLGLATAAVGAFGLLGHAYNAVVLYSLTTYTVISAHIALGLVLLGVGVVLGRPTLFPASLLLSQGSAGTVGRRLFLPIVLGPAALGWLWLHLGQQAWLSPSEAMAAFILLIVLLLMGLTWWCMAAVARMDHRRDRAEEALRGSEEQFRLLVNGVKDYAIFMLDPEGRVQSWNDGAQRIKGWTAQEIIGQSFTRFYTPEAVATGHPQAELERAAAQGSCEDEGWRIRKDGSRFWASVTITALRDPQGRLRGFSKITRDITNRKKAEEQIAGEKHLQQLLLDHFPGVVLLLRTTTREVVASNQAGKDVGAVCGSRCFETWGQSQDTCPWCLAQDLWATGKEQSVVIEAGGKAFEAHWAPVTDDLYMHYAFDITERKQAEQKLREKEQLIQQALSISNSFTFDWDTATDEVRRSASCQKVFGIDADEMCAATAKRFSERVHPDDRPQLAKVLSNLTPAADRYITDYRLVLSDESVVTLEETAQAFFDAAGKMQRVIGVATDITARKLAESNQRLVTELLRVVNRGGGDLHSLMSETLRLVRETTGFDAVGLRLRMGDNFPYYEQDGFSDDFLREENFLCEKRGDGSIVRDDQGQANLECTCGLVLQGRTDPSLPFFTEGGSFWTNVSSDLLALTPEVDPRTNPRNRCIHIGYQSVALVPIRSGEGIIGLLQLNDRREGRFTPESLHFFESLADNIGLAVQRKLAEEALQQSEEQLRLAATAAQIGTWSWKPGTSNVTVSANWRRLFGVSDTALVTFETWRDALHPEDRERAVNELNAASDQHREFNAEYRVVLPDGEVRWMIDRGRAWYDEQGRPAVMAGINLDITDRKQAEEALRESEERFRSYFELGLIGVAITSPVKGMMAANEKLCEILGYERSELLQLTWAELTHPDDLAADVADFNRVLAGEIDGYSIDKRFVRKDGQAINTTISVRAVRRADRSVDYFVALIQDITDRKRAEEGLRQLNAELEQRVADRTADVVAASEKVQAERQRLYDVLETLPTMICLLTPDYHVAFANRGFRQRFGESNGRHCFDYCFGRSEPCDFCESYKVLSTGLPHQWEVHGADGSVIEAYDFPFTDADGSPMILEMDVDITDRRRAEDAIRDLNETLEKRVAERTAELARSNTELEQFARVASHDLQEPLRTISAFLKLLQKQYEPQLDEKAKEYISYSVEGATRMSQLITDLLAYSRVTTQGKAMKPVDTNRSLGTALANLRGGIHDAGAKVTHDDLPTVLGDFTQLTQLFQNLIGNAVKFRLPDRPCQVHISAKQQDGEWVLTVHDNGIGIAPEQFKRIFVIFQRLHTREKYAGTGIGLAICKKIVERHGGRIWVESTVREGSTFCFTIPASKEQVT